MIKVLVVDDSIFIRRTLVRILEKDPGIQVIATASNGEEAIALTRKHDPDVITLDIEMPRMDGLTALRHIMDEHPCPVIMVSSLTMEGADATLRALELGALDYIPKFNADSVPDLNRLEAELAAKVTAIARRKSFMRLTHRRAKERAAALKEKAQTIRPAHTSLFPRTTQTTAQPTLPASKGLRAPSSLLERAAKELPPACTGTPLPLPRVTGRGSFEAVLIGVSTGGPPAVQKILSALPENFPVPILIAQHMPAAFTGPFAKRLDTQCAITVKEAADIERLKAGTAYISPGGKHLRIENRGGTLTCVVTEEPKTALYKPSANVLMETGGLALGRRVLGVMLTGMGSDGLEGTKILKEKGGHVIAQSEATCVVYGMPKAIVDANLADEIVDLNNMAAAILTHFSR